MPITRVFKSGHSQAVRIPAELAYSDYDALLNITRLGDVITIFPARQSQKDGIERLRNLPKPSDVDAREPIELPERDHDCPV
jgi:antitoxin VapB